ncbi:nucleotidyltransferase family protein [Bosea sp. 117]|uniref:nucleotidyltransferase family protein n=1 Tax=Bosea sp. 117 TaxID=1125973 RepID=UPI000494867F|nr:nucleotidyltransferase family protein [Bosea sp. 117]
MSLPVERYWPPHATALLLAAALHPSSEAARAAWSDWEALQIFEDGNWAELRIFPTVARRLTQLGIESSLVPRLVGVRRFMWSKMQNRIVAVRPYLAALAEAGIVPMLTKGAARVALDPREAAERYSHDIDTVIPPGRWAEAVDILVGRGLVCEYDWSRDRLVNRMREARHALSFRMGEADIDLHQSALMPNRLIGDDDALWARAVPASFAGVPVVAPCAPDRLMMSLAHGLLYDPARPGDWALDAVSALRAPAFDWTVFEREVRARGLSAFADAGLSFLVDGLGQEVPPEVRSRLAQDATPAFREELESLFHSHHPRTEREEGALCFAQLERLRGSVERSSPKGGIMVVQREWRPARPTSLRDAHIPVPADLSAVGELRLHLRLPAKLLAGDGPQRFRLFALAIVEIVLADWFEPPLQPDAPPRDVWIGIPAALLALHEAGELRLYLAGSLPADPEVPEYRWEQIPASPDAPALAVPAPPHVEPLQAAGPVRALRRHVKVMLPILNHPLLRHPRRLLPRLGDRRPTPSERS